MGVASQFYTPVCDNKVPSLVVLNFEIRCPVPVNTSTYYAGNNYAQYSSDFWREVRNSYSIRIVISPVSGKKKEEIPCFAQKKYCVCVCVFFLSILDIKFVRRTSRGHTGGRSHRIFNPYKFSDLIHLYSTSLPN